MTFRKLTLPHSRMRGVEQLETRDMLSGFGFGNFFAHAAHGIAAAQHAEVRASISTAASDQAVARIGSLADAGRHTPLTATLSDPNNAAASGSVSYRTYSGETELSVKVTGAAAESTLDVSLGDTVVGQVTTDADGNGTLVLSSDPTASEAPLPADFPTTVAAGTAVTVGTLAGALATPTNPGCDGYHGTHLRARLTDPDNSTASGSVAYHTGNAGTRLVIKVSGTTPDSSLDVAIDGAVVGQITTDANGSGKLILASTPQSSGETALPDNFPATITAGSTVTVGALTGAFAAGGHHGHFGGWRHH